MSVIKEMSSRFGIAGELLAFLWRERLWWMFPIVLVMLLFGILIVVGTTTGVGPFVYTVF